jgi:hypothetical protein
MKLLVNLAKADPDGAHGVDPLLALAVGTELTAKDKKRWWRGTSVTEDEWGGRGRGRNALSEARERQR